VGWWHEVEHTADLALRIGGEDLADLFSAAAQGMFALIATADTRSESRTHHVELTALDAEALLVDWLNELLYLHERHGLAYATFCFDTLIAGHLAADAIGWPVLERTGAIKAATYHNLVIQTSGSELVTEVVFDT
jgi:SHS2 domain-containing protein